MPPHGTREAHQFADRFALGAQNGEQSDDRFLIGAPGQDFFHRQFSFLARKV